MKLSLSTFGRTLTLALTSEPDEAGVEESADVATSATSSIEFGFSPSAAPGRGEYWEDDRG